MTGDSKEQFFRDFQEARYRRGLDTLAAMGSEGACLADTIEAKAADPALTDTERDFCELMVAHGFGAVWARPGLDAKSRSVATIAALASMRDWDQLRVHLALGMGNGLTADEIHEVLMQVSVYGGVACSATAQALAEQVKKDPLAPVKELTYPSLGITFMSNVLESAPATERGHLR